MEFGNRSQHVFLKIQSSRKERERKRGYRTGLLIRRLFKLINRDLILKSSVQELEGENLSEKGEIYHV